MSLLLVVSNGLHVHKPLQHSPPVNYTLNGVLFCSHNQHLVI